MNDLANREMSASGNKYAFGVDRDALAAKLQQLADDVRAEHVLPQEVSLATRNVQDDFELITLTVTYAEPRGVSND